MVLKSASRFTLVVAVLCLMHGTVTAFAQRQTDRDEYRGVYRNYDMSLSGPDTKAPRGYKPFYISHYGRHGSRYPVDRGYLLNPVNYLEPAEEAGLLTEKGKWAINAFRTLDTLTTNSPMGDLCSAGEMEHRELGRWMGSRWPKVFRGRRNIKVDCSYLPRCIHSMQNFTAGLSSEFPKLSYEIDSSEVIYSWLVNNLKVKKATHGARLDIEAVWPQGFDWQPFLSSLFTDPDEAVRLAGSAYMICEVIYTNASMVPAYAPESGIDAMALFNEEEYKEICRLYNNKMWGGHCNSTLSGDWRIHRMDSLLVRWVEEADAAIAAKPREALAANLRFGHDTSMMPLLSLMGINHFDRQVPTAEADKYFNSSMDMTMATNLVMVCYRSRRGPVLVKFVHNGRETSIPALTPVEGPYYKWSDVREWFLGRTLIGNQQI